MHDDKYEMVGFDGFGTLGGIVYYNQIADKMDNFFRYVHNDDVIEVEFTKESSLFFKDVLQTTFYLVYVNYDDKIFCWSWDEDEDQLYFNCWSDIRLVSDSEPSYNDIDIFKSNYGRIETDQQKEIMTDLDRRDKALQRYQEVGGSMIEQVTIYKKIEDIFNLSTKIKESVSEGKGNVVEVPYRNEVLFAITDDGKIKVISYECNEPSFLGEEEISWNEESQVTDESMWNKLYKSVFFADFSGNSHDGDVTGGWSIDLDSPNCNMIFDFSGK